MPGNRYMDLINNRNMVIKTPNGRKTQIWYFDQKSLTVKTKYNNQSFISRLQEEPLKCKSGAPTLDGGKSSPINKDTSLIGKTRNALKLKETKMRKDTRSL